MTPDEKQSPLGQPAGVADPEPDPDFAGEHEDTAVSKDITGGQDEDAEPEAPGGWSGMEPTD
ncbi:hypothetical protein [Catenuloplanes atrovinosus]|uniref:Uncharacterized protein n=1 Tax=Catenuloplanes atrovinosus TaxID=137266 RepID=A0AAE4C9R2_9ACTN|nr:hypothetical protein [Catenuloplanes atrovinosus]MDR7276821.1 hypothetical protein [Catenuloplanes atrovinosus]